MRVGRTLASALAVLALGSGLAACGDDDDDVATEDTTVDADDTDGDAAEGDLATYCDKTVEIETLGEPDVDFESASEEEIAEAVKAYAADEIVPLAHEIQDVAPAEVKSDIDILVSKTEELAETGDFEAAFGGEFEEVGNRVHAHDLGACAWQRVEVIAKNYAFDGIDAKLEAGITSFDLRNDGTELHEVTVIRKNDDTTESFDELLALPEEEAMQKTTMIGGAFAPPGGVDYFLADLEAGEYLAVCFIPVGSVDEETEADGPPHFTQGMRSEFTVS